MQSRKFKDSAGGAEKSDFNDPDDSKRDRISRKSRSKNTIFQRKRAPEVTEEPMSGSGKSRDQSNAAPFSPPSSSMSMQ